MLTSTKSFRALNSCWWENCLSVLCRFHWSFPTSLSIPISPISSDSSHPKGGGAFPPAVHSPATHLCSDLPRGKHPSFHPKLPPAIPHKEFQGMQRGRLCHQGCDKSYICSPGRSGAVTLLWAQPGTEQAGAPGKRRGSGWKQ